MDYRIGLDIGITSVGWAVLENDSNDEPKRIIDFGVRIFEAAENPKNGESLAAPRRNARSMRRRLRRRKHRLERIRDAFEEIGLISKEELAKYFKKENLENVYELRYMALERMLKEEEFAQILLHIAKHRGFKSNRKAETAEKETGRVLEAVNKNKLLMEEKQYRTIGEMLFKDESFRVRAYGTGEELLLAPRNKADDYKNTILRDFLENEVKTIFESQRSYGNAKASQELEKVFLEIMLSQRSFDSGPGYPSPYGGDLINERVGFCTLEPQEKRAAKACYTSERFVLLQKINHLTLVDGKGEIITLSRDQRKQLLELVYSQKAEVKFDKIRKKLDISKNYRFKGLNYLSEDKDGSSVEGKTKFVAVPYFHAIRKALDNYEIKSLDAEKIKLLDRIGYLLTVYKSDERRREELAKLSLSETNIESLLFVNPTKFQHISIKAMQNIMQCLEDGDIYTNACIKVGYNPYGNKNGKKNKLITGDILKEVLEDIPNPVVKRAISQTVKVVNAIIRKYGSPQAIRVELAREMSKNFDDRKKMQKDMEKNEKINEAAVRELQSMGKNSPTGLDIVKYKLWKEQGEFCLYSQDRITRAELFDAGGVEVDHILPYSITFDDSYRNKALVKAKCNQEKANRTPFEYFGENENAWHKYETFVKSQIRDYRKQQKLLKQHITEEEKEAFKERNLQDTKYISRVVYNLLTDYLAFEPYNNQGKKREVFAINGAVTSYLRKRWGIINKDRSTDRHHATDAIVIASCTEGMIQKISRYMKGRELKYAKNFKLYDEMTGKYFDRRNFTREQWDEEFGVKIPYPWEWFKKEVEMRTCEYPQQFMKEYLKMGYPDDLKEEDIRPLFVSRMPNHKITGAGHADTIRSPRHFAEQGIVLTKTDLKKLKLDENDEIIGYYNPDSDRILYEALKKQLILYAGVAEKAFEQPFHKPKSDGSNGPLVKKVKIFERQSIGVYVNEGRGIAGNGSMIRVDIFCENGKYYFVPIYIADTKKKVLPNRAATPGKAYDKWKVINEEDFIFSLYSRDLFKFKRGKPMNISYQGGRKGEITEGLVYYIGADISTASFICVSQDKEYSFRGFGIQNVKYLKKYQVDVLGKVAEIKKERRMSFL